MTKEKYCALCGCLFSLPLIRNPENPDPNEDPMLPLNDPYDSRVLPAELTAVHRPYSPQPPQSQTTDEANSGLSTSGLLVAGMECQPTVSLKRKMLLAYEGQTPALRESVIETQLLLLWSCNMAIPDHSRACHPNHRRQDREVARIREY